jgi:peptide-methionine (S)-S-oxide reductase
MNKLFASILAASLFVGVFSCSYTTDANNTKVEKYKVPAVDNTRYGKLQTAYFAAGCFWAVEGIFDSLKGVKEAESGYSGGNTKNPTYRDVVTETTGHAETVAVHYDPAMISYSTLLEVYFASQDPTQVNGQGPDHGDSYRSVIFYTNTEEQKLATDYKNKLASSGKYKKPITVQIVPFKAFYKAEEYHQNYDQHHADEPYVASVSIPRIERAQALFPKLLK